MKNQELAERLELKAATKVFDRDVTGVYISDMVSDVIANAKAVTCWSPRRRTPT